MKQMNRRCFFRDVVVGVATCLSAPQFCLGADPKKVSVSDLFASRLIIDGTLSPVPKGDSWLLTKGEVKRRTGVDIAVVHTSVDRLPRYPKFFQRYSDVYHLIQTAEDLTRAKKDGKCGIVIYMQKDFSLNGDLDRLLEWKKLGLRVLQFTYSGRNELGGGSDFDDEPLSEFGKSVLKACNANGILVDVSHCGKQTTLDIASGSTKPVTANHANAEELCGHRRNKSLEEIRAIVATGGVIGVTTIGRFLQPKERRSASIDDFLNHIDYIVEKVGIEHVGISSDCYLDGKQVYPQWDNTDRFLNSYERWHHVAHRLVKRGYKERDLIKILGGNFLRVFRSTFDAERLDPASE
jgi:membrane dipeptidase